MVPLTMLAILGLVATPVLAAPASKRVVGGTSATPGEFPFIVDIQKNREQVCGGSLLDAQHIITAAHCSRDWDGTPLEPSTFQIRAGSNNRQCGGKLVGISQITTHPAYNRTTHQNDIAIWTLAAPLDTSAKIGYAVLPPSGADPAPGTDMVVAGWGATNELAQSFPTSLLKATVPVVDREACKEAYKNYTGGHPDKNMFCAGFKQGGRDSCDADSGGPIVDASTKVLNGIVNWGDGCARPEGYGVYLRLGNYIEWIEQTLSRRTAART